MNLNPDVIGLIGLADKAGVVVKGFEKSMQLVKKGKILFILVTEDLGKNTKEELIVNCKMSQIPLIFIGDSRCWMDKLRLNNKVIGLKRSPLSLNILKRLRSVDG